MDTTRKSFGNAYTNEYMTMPSDPHPPTYQEPPTEIQPEQYQQAPQPVAPPKGLALSALIVGVVAFLMGLLPIFGALVGITAIVLGVIALTKKQPKGLAVTGLILGAVALIASISVTAGLGALTGEVVKAGVEEEIVAPAEQAEPEVEEEVAPAPPTVEQQSFTGTGDFVQSVEITDVAFVTFSCTDCERNTVLKTDGPESLLVNTIGAYSGSHLINLSDNSMTTMFEINATGTWTLTVGPITDAPQFDATATGTGDAAFRMGGPGSIAEITNAGERNFAVKVYGASRPNLAVNTIGSYSGVVPFEMPSFVQVTSSGNWSITAQ